MMEKRVDDMEAQVKSNMATLDDHATAIKDANEV